MALPELIRKSVEKKLEHYCAARVPPELRGKVRLGYKIRGNSVTLAESRPHFSDPSIWVDIVVAQFRYDPSQRRWTLYCADRNSRWMEYLDARPTSDLDELLREVDEDPTGIFWG
ncbi:MAG: DUF3024 domain-containing protein [candidate division NC10 bacterium]|nr:DUF3024 domain-containing protein [candidate division NC10 bacterium]